ncbi:MAG: hypothetical protein JWO36_7306 [Myxococcales bacterium]|nr:hypothetical protein [Myxococcales bacterium]
MRLPWYIWTSFVSVTCILIGGYWDISWHMSIGRDSFWTPAHLAIQLGGIVSGVAGSYLIISTTLRRGVGIRVWGFCGPLGAFIGVWGAATMVVSAPFDNWWHAAYGLDVKILSPPHVVLTLGILGVAAGAVLLVISTLNGATGAARDRLRMLILVIGGEILVLALTAILEHTFVSNLHRADSYRAMAIVVPVASLAIARAAGGRWATTTIAATYTGFMLLALWILPLFPAEPKLGPVYQPITHFIPLEFPLLVIVPAIAIDLVRARIEAWPRSRQALVLGVMFVATVFAVEWPFASFLQTPATYNWFFGTHYFAYFMQPEWYTVQHEFMPDDAFAVGMIEALIAGTLTSWLGLAIGDAMKKVRR